VSNTWPVASTVCRPYPWARRFDIPTRLVDWANPVTLETVSTDSTPLVTNRGVVELTRQLVDIHSVSGDEKHLADLIDATLRQAPHLEVLRHGNTVAARTQTEASQRVLIAGHIDTVPVSGTLPAVLAEGVLWGRGSVDMKGGVASHLIHALDTRPPRLNITWVFYDQEEVDADKNGLGQFLQAHPEWMAADFGILGEPSNARIEGGCNGTLRAVASSQGRQAHSARPWMGDNAIHALAPLITRLATHTPETRTVDGLDYRESLQAVGVAGGVAGNVVPDAASVTINFRFAPDRSVADAIGYVTEFCAGYQVDIVDAAPGARPGMDQALAADFVRFVGSEPAPKYGWTDVSRLSAAGIPAVNFGPGDPSLAHSAHEQVPVDQLEFAHRVLGDWLFSS
jgi:succinyl-diaminopimelate desuccinylase